MHKAQKLDLRNISKNRVVIDSSLVFSYPRESIDISEYHRIVETSDIFSSKRQEAPVIINLPVLKRHFAGQITSALKNHFGSVHGLHRWLARASLRTNRDYFDRKLTEFASAVRPELTITDVRSLQAVSGPRRRSNTKIVDEVNRLIITGDMIVADVVVMDLMKRYDNTFTQANEAIVRRQHAHAEELGIGTSDLSKLEIIEVKV